MSHAKNEQIAKNLRRLADSIEKSEHEYSCSFSAYGGDAETVTITPGPMKFGPIGYALVLGGEGFVSAHQVVAIDQISN